MIIIYNKNICNNFLFTKKIRLKSFFKSVIHFNKLFWLLFILNEGAFKSHILVKPNKLKEFLRPLFIISISKL